ncbi:MAG: riboflavin synthase, alpha subunit [Actinobacteria bacterium]|jgi:riboflavin synthase|nr:riboflavin synthase, alpha subunit [Actinomycetota bacterium]
MFTGIIEEVGRVTAAGGLRLAVSCGFGDLGIGDSIAVNGVCLTVMELDAGTFAAELSEETLARTSLGTLTGGSPVNLERPVPVGGRLGGHVVQGHVDGTGTVAALDPQEGSVLMWIEAPRALQRYLVEKGSVAVDGVSLTVAGVRGDAFSVALIPHTLTATTLQSKAPGDAVNLEVDILAKYVESLLCNKPEAPLKAPDRLRGEQ